MGVFADFLGTLRTSFKVGNSSLSSASLTANRTHSLPDLTGQLVVDGGYYDLPQIAVTEGATAPNPGATGVLAWSTTLLSVVRWDGTTWNAMAGGAPGLSLGQVLALPYAF